MAGGDWITTPMNWLPHGIPGPGDRAFITISNNYSVTLDNSTTNIVAGLILGGNGGNPTLFIEGVLTNTGTVTLAGGSLILDGCSGAATLVNSPGALIDAQVDNGISSFCYAPGIIINEGTFLQSGGTGTNIIDVTFINTGTLDVESGTLAFSGPADAGGSFNNSKVIGTGDIQFVTGQWTFAGSPLAAPVQLMGAAVGGNIDLQGPFTFYTGAFFAAPSGISITIETNATLTWAGNYNIVFGITNAGSFVLTNGSLYFYTGGLLLNLPGALVDWQTDGEIDYDGGPGIINEGTFQKSGGTNTSIVYPPFVTSGTVNGVSGTLSFDGGLTCGGWFTNQPGAIVDAGAYGTSYVQGNLSGTLTVYGGDITEAGQTLTISTNGILVDAGGAYIFGAVTNAGIFQVTAGEILFGNNYYNPSAAGLLFNEPGGLVDLQTDVTIDYNYGLGIINQGTFQKSGGTNTSIVYPPFVTSGTVNGVSGTLSFDGGLTCGGWFTNQPGAIVAVGAYGTSYVQGNLSGTLTVYGGDITEAGQTLSISTNGILVNAGVVYIFGAVTNAGIFRVTAGEIVFGNNNPNQTGLLFNEPGGVVDLQGDFTFGYNYGPGIVNQGTLRKSTGTGVSYVYSPFNNQGLLDLESGQVWLHGPNTLAGSINFGISSLTNFGSASIQGTPSLSIPCSVTLNNGYTPPAGASFPLCAYNTHSGAFTPLTLPPWISWKTNYGPSLFSLIVSNSQPVVTASAKLDPVASLPVQFQLNFLGNPASSYTVLSATNLNVPATNWTVLGSATLVSNSVFEFIDGQTTNTPQRFYSVRSP